MNVENFIKLSLNDRKLHLTLIDPDEQNPETALKIAQEAIKGGTDGIMLGGSTTEAADLDATAKILQ